VLEENVRKGLPVPVVTAAKHHWEIVAQPTMTPCSPSTHDGWTSKLYLGRDIACLY
jgi:hypothetical protein